MSKSIDSFFGKKAALPSSEGGLAPPEGLTDAAKATCVFGASD